MAESGAYDKRLSRARSSFNEALSHWLTADDPEEKEMAGERLDDAYKTLRQVDLEKQMQDRSQEKGPRKFFGKLVSYGVHGGD